MKRRTPYGFFLSLCLLILTSGIALAGSGSANLEASPTPNVTSA